MGVPIRRCIEEFPWDPGESLEGGGWQLQHGKEEEEGEEEEGGLFWSICLAFHFLLFFIELLSPAPTSFLLRSEQTEAQETHGGSGKRSGEGDVGGQNRGQTTVRLSVRPAARDLGASHASCPGISEDKAAAGRGGKLHGTIPIRWWVLGVSKEYLWPKFFPLPEPIKRWLVGWLVGVEKFNTRLCCSGHDPASPKGLVSPGMEEFHPFQPGGGVQREAGATHEAKRCHGASGPVLTRGLRRCPHHRGRGVPAPSPSSR